MDDHSATLPPGRSDSLYFAEVLDAGGKRLHVGCVMARGVDWVEVSLPEHLALSTDLLVRFSPSPQCHAVREDWRGIDRVGFTYVADCPDDAGFSGLPCLGRAASRRAHATPAPCFTLADPWGGSKSPRY